MLKQWLKQYALTLVMVLGLNACTGLGPTLVTSDLNTPSATKKSEKFQIAIPSEVNNPTQQGTPAIPETFSKPITNDLWDRLPSHFTIPIPVHEPQIQSQIRWFLHHQAFLNRTAKRAAPYMYYILERVQERNLPAELALLPIIESAYYPMASSSVGATGLWQLMPGTANKFGLKQDWWYDGRRDIFASTNAALDYFTYLENYFDGNWLLAIAAYDAGEGTVQNAIQRNAHLGKGTDFWSLPLPQETTLYVPRLLALAELIRNRRAYPINLPPIDDQPYLGQVDVDSQIKLTDAARLAGLTLPEFQQLNPGYRHLDADPHGPYKITLPINKIAVFRENMANGAAIPEQTPSLTDTDTVTGYAIAKVQQDATLTDMLPNKAPSVLGDDPQTEAAALPTLAQDDATNSDEAENNDETSKEPIEPEAAHPPIKIVKHPLYHRVKSGESLSIIAANNKIKISDLQQWNSKQTLAHLKPGVKLIIGYQTVTASEEANPRLTTQKSHLTHSSHSRTYSIKRQSSIKKPIKAKRTSKSHKTVKIKKPKHKKT